MRVREAVDNGWRFVHVGMVVSNLEASMAFYKGLGFEAQEVLDLTVPEGGLMVNGQPSKTTIGLKICNVRRAEITLELIEPVAGDFVHMDWLNREGEGVNHIFFTVPNLEVEKAKLTEEGFDFVFGDESFAFFDTRGGGNILLELGQSMG